MNFITSWKNLERFDKAAALTPAELKNVHNKIADMMLERKKKDDIVAELQNRKKLREKYRAEQVVRTESKRIQTQEIKEDAKELDVEKFRIVPSPHACDLCLSVSGNGKKVFKSNQLKKDGQSPPLHVNCNCLLLPIL